MLEHPCKRELSTCPAVGRSAGLQRQKAARSPGVQALFPLAIPSSPGAKPSPRRPAAAQTYLRVGGRGLRRAVRAPQRRVRPSRWGRAALALRSRGRARTALSLTQPSSAPTAVAVAAGAAERLQTCSVSGPARVEATKSHPRRGRLRPSCRAVATSWRRPHRRLREKGGEALLKIAPAEGSYPLPAHPLSARPRSELSSSRSWRSAGPLPWETVPQEQTPAREARAESQLLAAGYGTPPRPRSPELPRALDRDIEKKLV